MWNGHFRKGNNHNSQEFRDENDPKTMVAKLLTCKSWDDPTKRSRWGDLGLGFVALGAMKQDKDVEK